MPVLDLSLIDLDVRDTQNRPVKTAGEKQLLSALFMDSLFDLTVLNETHGMAQIWSDLKLYSHLFHDLIFNVAHPLWVLMTAALQPSTKRFVHNVHNLWITAFVGILLSNFAALKIFLTESPRRVNLRC